MNDSCSRELGLILNLRNAAIDHKLHCEHNCNVSLYQLKDAARYLADRMRARNVRQDEIKEANKFINEMPIL